MKLKRPQLVPNSSVVKLFREAELALERKDFQQNLELLERARKMDPANPAILLQLGRSHGFRFNYATAEECFEKAVQISNHKTLMLAMAGSQSSDFYNTDLAERYLRRATEQKDAAPAMLVQLAGLYERLRRLDEAGKLIDRALLMERDFPPALLARARMERHAGHLEEAEKLLRSLLPKADRDTRIRANYQLGAVLDRQGRYDEAMSAFIEAKAPFQSEAGAYFLQRQIVSAHWREMLSGISPEILQRWFDSGRELQPARRLGLLCGHPRSGTTLLEQVLDSHPDIISAEETEIFYEDVYVPMARTRPPETPRPGLPEQFQITVRVELSTLEASSTDLLRQLRENYFRSMELCLGQPIGGRLLIDKKPSLSLLLLGFQRVFPEIKLVVALRDPRDVCMSCFMQYFSPLGLRHTAYFNLKDTVEEYVEDMNIWRTLAPLIQGRYLEVRYEDMVEDLESVSRKTLEFLGVPWDAKVLKFDEHARQKQVRTPSYADVAKPVFKTAKGRWRNYQKYLEPYLHRLAPFVKAFGYE
ncbi:MAG: sulfotransferase [Verrucomicrobiota bacterium]|jgi:tetratricopeptide (TPR) repeat protein